MIIPVKCFTCGEILGNKYRYYQQEVRKLKFKKDQNNVVSVEYLTTDNVKKTPEGVILDQLKLHKYCCRRHMLTHVDIM